MCILPALARNTRYVVGKPTLATLAESGKPGRQILSKSLQKIHNRSLIDCLRCPEGARNVLNVMRQSAMITEDMHFASVKFIMTA
jgi:hypothetical protein